MLSQLHARVDWVLSRIEDAAVVMAGIAIILTMLLVSADAILRYALRAPLAFQLHLTEFYLLPISMLLALAWGYRNGGTIQIRVLLHALPERVTSPVIRLGLAAARVDSRKRRHLGRAAAGWMAETGFTGAARFDVALVVLGGRRPEVEYLESAFVPTDDYTV